MTVQPRVVTTIVGAGVLAIAAAFAIAGSAGLGASGATIGGTAQRAPADTAVSAAALTLSSGMAKPSTGDDLLTTASVIVTVSRENPDLASHISNVTRFTAENDGQATFTVIETSWALDDRMAPDNQTELVAKAKQLCSAAPAALVTHPDYPATWLIITASGRPLVARRGPVSECA